MTESTEIPLPPPFRPPDSGGCEWRREMCFLQGADMAASFNEVSSMLEEMTAFLKGIAGLDKATSANLRLVCDELASNAARHVAPRQEVRVRVELSVDSSRVHLSYRDNGAEFDPLHQAEPYVGGDLEQRQVGGLGLYLIVRMFPDAHYTRQSNWNLTEVECLRS